MPITLREIKGSALTHAEMDKNLKHLIWYSFFFNECENPLNVLPMVDNFLNTSLVHFPLSVGDTLISCVPNEIKVIDLPDNCTSVTIPSSLTYNELLVFDGDLYPMYCSFTIDNTTDTVIQFSDISVGSRRLHLFTDENSTDFTITISVPSAV